jgi:hypothetical protein
MANRFSTFLVFFFFFKEKINSDLKIILFLKVHKKFFLALLEQKLEKREKKRKLKIK